MKEVVTLEQKIAAVERLIEDLRWARSEKEVLENQTYVAMKAIATELRARKVAEQGTTRSVIGARIAAAVRHARPDGRYLSGHLINIGQEVIGRWREIEYALERCEREKVE